MLKVERGEVMITQRQSEILNLIVELFTQTHEPIGSKTLQATIDSSGATIRNDMAKLEKLGLLEKAHTSSGRMPSAAGFKYFVEHSLSLDSIDERDIYQVVKAFDFEAFKLDDILQLANFDHNQILTPLVLSPMTDARHKLLPLLESLVQCQQKIPTYYRKLFLFYLH